MSDPGIGTYVRYWLHYSNLASSFFKQFGSVRKIRDDYEKQIINTLNQNGMEKATIQIGGGQIHVIDKREPNQLSLTKIEDLLHGYFKQRGGKDESKDIIFSIDSDLVIRMVEFDRDREIQTSIYDCNMDTTYDDGFIFVCYGFYGN
jgi:hypothetical protein